MNDAQESHLVRVKDAFDLWVEVKYRAGACEHDGNLMDMSKKQLLDNAIDEAIDLFVYLTTLREAMDE